MPSPDAQPRYQPLPPLSDQELEELTDSIAEYGVLEPVVVDENGRTLDGHHRALVCDQLGIECPTRTLAGLTEEEKRDYAFMVNVARRQMSAAAKIDLWRQRRASIAERLRSDPARSDRAVAAEVGVDHHTVAKERSSLERNGDIPILSRVGRGEPVEEPINNADHRGLPVATVIVDYTVDNTAIRQRGAAEAPREKETVEWRAEMTLTSPAPQSAAAVRPFWQEIAARGEREMLRDPLLTMRTLAASET